MAQALTGNSADHARIGKMLLAAGAFAYGRTKSGESVLHACARDGNIELTRKLLSMQARACLAEPAHRTPLTGPTGPTLLWDLPATRAVGEHDRRAERAHEQRGHAAAPGGGVEALADGA